MNETKISWCDLTWNPTFGCSVVSPGCENCYAEAIALRFGHSKKPWKAQNANDNVILKPHKLSEARSPKLAGKRVFVNSMSDLFHELVPLTYIDKVFIEMEQRPDVTFQVLTKRPARMAEYMRGSYYDAEPPHNVWLGTSVEDQRRADERIPHLVCTPAAIRFLSCEPLLAPIDLRIWLGNLQTSIAPPAISWVIAGGESGPRFRPMDLQWPRDLQRQCAEAGVPFFFKQIAHRLNGQGADALGPLYHEFPK